MPNRAYKAAIVKKASASAKFYWGGSKILEVYLTSDQQKAPRYVYREKWCDIGKKGKHTTWSEKSLLISNTNISDQRRTFCMELDPKSSSRSGNLLRGLFYLPLSPSPSHLSTLPLLRPHRHHHHLHLPHHSLPPQLSSTSPYTPWLYLPNPPIPSTYPQAPF